MLWSKPAQSTTETQAATLQRFIDAWQRWSAEDWLAVFADDFTQVTLPASLGIPSRSRAEVEVMLPALVATVKSYQLTVHHTLHSPQTNSAAIYASSTGTLPWGSPWKMEYSVFLTFTEDGSKVAVLEEMLDTDQLHEFAPKFGRYLAQNGGPVAVANAANADKAGMTATTTTVAKEAVAVA